MPIRFTPEVALAHPVVSDAVISPDGDVIAYVVADATRPSGPGRPAFPASAIHLVPAAGGPSIRATYGRADTTPRWSPDGQWLAFLSDRESDGQRQVHLMPRHGGEARQVTHVDSEILHGRSLNPVAWFPDGRRIAFLMTDPLPADARVRQARGDDRIVFEEEPRFWRLWSVDIDTGVVKVVSPPDLQVWEFALSPDGSLVAAIVADHPYEWDWYYARLATFAVGGTASTTLHQTWRQIAKPAWSPDGFEIAFLTSNLSDRGIDAGLPMVISAGGGTAREIGGGATVSDANLVFHPDGRVLTASNVHAGAGVSAIDLETGGRTWLWTAEQSIATISRATMADGTDRVAAVIDDLEHPAEVHVGDVSDGAIAWRKLTSIHAEWTDVERGEARQITWAASDGQTIQGFLFLPPGRTVGASGPLPLVTQVHGGPTGCVRFEYHYGHRWARVLADAGLAVFVPNFRGSTGWGLEFAEANIGDMGGADLDDILTGIDALVAQGIADPDRLGICGWSYGGFMTAWATGHTTRFKAAMAGAAITDWRSFHARSYLHAWDRLHYGGSDPYDPASHHTRFSPLTYVKDVRTPTLVLHGELDWDAPVEQGYTWHRALKDLGVETQLVVYPREPHGLSEYEHRRDLLVRLRDWMVDHLVG